MNMTAAHSPRHREGGLEGQGDVSLVLFLSCQFFRDL
jgi:hypothetical protein